MNGVSGIGARSSSTERRLPNRDPVTWNGCGRPSARSAIASPSSTSGSASSASTASTTSGTCAVTSSSERV